MTDFTASSPRVRVCAIGGSAGGVDALQQFFTTVGTDLGVAYVVILHLPSGWKSELPHLIARWTTMPVQLVHGATHFEITPNCVFVVAPSQTLEIVGATVAAAPLASPREQRSVIDRSFRALARLDQPIAIVLSGLGRDGTAGAGAVKAAGGVVGVQDPHDAAFAAMPQAVISRGLADAVLPIRALAARLREWAQQPAREELAVNAAGRRRAAAADAGALPAARAPDERSASMFGGPQSWEAFSQEVVGPLVAQTVADEQIRVWIPECGTGEDAYATAILFYEAFARMHVRRPLLVFATDPDARALAIARRGLYPAEVIADVEAKRRERFFAVANGRVQVSKDVRADLVFAVHDLLRDPPFSRIHVIVSRSVAKGDAWRWTQIVDVFRYAGRNGGFLFLGIPHDLADDHFIALNHAYGIFGIAKPALAPSSRDDDRVVSVRHGAPRRALDTRDGTAAWPVSEMSSPAVLVDHRGRVLQLSAAATRYFTAVAELLPQPVIDLARPELKAELRALLSRTREDGEPRLTPFLTVAVDDQRHRVALMAQRRSRGDRSEVLISVLDAGPVAVAPESPDATGAHGAHLVERLHEAERRLELLRDDYDGLATELDTANERLHSAHEEYAAATEELETSQEELQSINEELTTVNDELQAKLEEVSRSRSDLENLMEATKVGTLFLDADLQIMRFTPELATLFNVRPVDIGRPIADLTHSLRYDDLEADARQVLDTTRPLERHVVSVRGGSYLAQWQPYRTPAGTAQAGGIVVSFVDVTALKKAELSLRRSQAQLERELSVMRRLHVMTTQVATSASMADALDHVIAAAVELQGADHGTVLLVERESQRLEVVAARGDGPAPRDDSSMGPEHLSISARALRTRSIMQVADLDDPSQASLRSTAGDEGFRAIQSTPLISQDGQLVGMLILRYRAPHTFTERDTQLSALLGRQAADLIDSRIRRMQATASEAAASEVRRLLNRLVTVQEEERRRIARDIHDQMGQQMTALRMNLAALEGACDAGSPLAEHVARTAQVAQELDRTVEFLAWGLRPAALDHLGVSGALEELVRGWSERFQIPADFHAPETGVPLSPTVAVHLYRIVQEALHNVYKHAHASRACVVLDVEDNVVVLSVEDDGKGFVADPSVAGRRADAGFGLVHLRERARLVGGECEIESVPGRGTTVFVRVPLAPPVGRDDGDTR